ncbi:MAG: thiol peroxidase [Myxococcota bacterium]|jgi:thiol peroxidase|nr:thiol peroxidase [Myxococcota bacterium]
MAQITLKGTPIHTVGELPAIGSVAPPFTLVGSDLREVRLADHAGEKKLLNVFPSVDTPVCARSVRVFNERAAARPGVVVLNVSADLPFAHARFCGAEGLDGVESLSTFRSSFARDYQLQIADGPLAGLCSRCVILLDERDQVVYTEQVPEITQNPDYERALAALG